MIQSNWFVLKGKKITDNNKKLNRKCLKKRRTRVENSCHYWNNENQVHVRLRRLYQRRGSAAVSLRKHLDEFMKLHGCEKNNSHYSSTFKEPGWRQGKRRSWGRRQTQTRGRDNTTSNTNQVTAQPGSISTPLDQKTALWAVDQE